MLWLKLKPLKKVWLIIKAMRLLKILLFSIFILFLSCGIDNGNLDRCRTFNKNIQSKYASDARVSIYSISFENKNNTIVITGETNNHLALNKLLQKLKAEEIRFQNNVKILPDATIAKPYAVVNNSVANLRRAPKHSAELMTQAILGTELKIYKYEDSFYLVQTPNKYLAWVDEGGIVPKNNKNFSIWKQSKKIIYTKVAGNIYDNWHFNSIVSDIVLGAQLKLLEETNRGFKVEFPDGRVGYVKKEEAMLYNLWLKNLKPSKELIENYASQFLGSPYLWGGTSTKAMDCSGFVKTIYLMNGFVIPRDASQQIKSGEIVDANLIFKGLEKGDLMFFGTKATKTQKQRVTHVGIWLGNGKQEIIHSSGRVRLNSVDENSKMYSEYLAKHYLGSRRYLGVKDSLIIDLKKELIEDLKD